MISRCNRWILSSTIRKYNLFDRRNHHFRVRSFTWHRKTSIKSAVYFPSHVLSLREIATQAQSYTSSEHEGTDSTLLNASQSHLILPFLTQPTDREETIRYHLHTLNILISIGDIERAKRLLFGLYKLYPDEINTVVDIKVHNALLNSLMDQKPHPQTRQALRWFNYLEKFKMSPNLTTYAIMIKGFIRENVFNVAHIFIKDLMSKGYTLDDLFHISIFNDEDINAILKFHQEIPGLKDYVSTQPDLDPISSTSQEKGNLDEASPKAISTNTLGIRLLRKTLDSLYEERLQAHERQTKLEEAAVEAEISRIQTVGNSQIKDKLRIRRNLGPLKKYVFQWVDQLMPIIEEEQKKTFDDHNQFIGFLKLLPAERIAYITIQQVLLRSLQQPDSTTVVSVSHMIGNELEMDYHTQQLKKKSNSFLLARKLKIQDLLQSGKIFNMTVRRIAKRIEAEAIQTDWITKWPLPSKMRIGSFLLDQLLKTAKISIPKLDPVSNTKCYEIAPAFHHYIKQVGFKNKGMIGFHSYLYETLSREPAKDMVAPRMLPMLVPPRPWLTYNSGGYFLTPHLCMRINPDAPDQTAYLQKACDEDRLSLVLASLDVLGSTAWQVNSDVFNVVIKAWNSGEAIADIPPIKCSEPPPVKPEDFDENPESRSAYIRQVEKHKNKVNSFHSMRCDVNYKVEIARAFLNYPFYFPHNMDFRGRAYPMPPHFNHVNNDLCRGLLLFHEKKKIGSKGLRWIKIHLANVYGYDKYSFDERVKFTEDHLDDIFDSADKPLEGRRWWLSAEEPWQCLATSIELTKILRSPDPHEYESGLPVHQDGTCNGLQHYAALGGDRVGAQQVNLLPSDRPQDVYSGVADIVNKLVDQDLEEGVPEAKLLKGRISRKIIKQTVMTNVYGVTLFGARQQIENRLAEIPELSIPDLEPSLFKLSLYLSHKVFASLGEIFDCARKIQHWLNEAARIISRSVPAHYFDEDGKLLPSYHQKPMCNVIWTTPLGMTVVQPYRKFVRTVIDTNLQSITYFDQRKFAPVNSSKQKAAFPPNFVHSLDASHMFLSALRCKREGLAFAAVHDSYWTHPSDVDTMNTIIRKEFVSLHKIPILSNLLKEFQERYSGFKMPLVKEAPKKPESNLPFLSEDEGLSDVSVDTKENFKKAKVQWVDIQFPPLPETGDFSVEEVEKSDYFFS